MPSNPGPSVHRALSAKLQALYACSPGRCPALGGHILKFFFQGLIYRLFNCALCNVLVLICGECDCGHRYCSKEHSKEGRRRKCAQAQAKYQRNRHDTWVVAHKEQQRSYRDRKRAEAEERTQCPVVSVGGSMPEPQPVASADEPQPPASSSSPSPRFAEKVVVASPLITQTQQNETASPFTMITSVGLTGNGLARAASAVQGLSPVTTGPQGPQRVEGLSPENQRAQEREQAVSGVTDHSLSGPQAPVKVSTQLRLATTGNTGEHLTEPRLRHKPMCCAFC